MQFRPPTIGKSVLLSIGAFCVGAGAQAMLSAAPVIIQSLAVALGFATWLGIMACQFDGPKRLNNFIKILLAGIFGITIFAIHFMLFFEGNKRFEVSESNKYLYFQHVNDNKYYYPHLREERREFYLKNISKIDALDISISFRLASMSCDGEIVSVPDKFSFRPQFNRINRGDWAVISPIYQWTKEDWKYSELLKLTIFGSVDLRHIIRFGKDCYSVLDMAVDSSNDVKGRFTFWIDTSFGSEKWERSLEVPKRWKPAIAENLLVALKNGQRNLKGLERKNDKP